jgi:hypothetical protein
LLLREKERRRGKAEIAGLLKALELEADCVIEMAVIFLTTPGIFPIFSWQ